MVDRAHDPPSVGADVEDVDAAGRLLESAQEGSVPGEGVAEDRPVDGAVEHEQRSVPVCVGEERVDLRQDAVEERADRLPAEKSRLERDDPAEGGGHHRLYFVGSDVADVAALDLSERVARLRIAVGGDDAGGLERALEPPPPHPPESDPAQPGGGGPGPPASPLPEHDLPPGHTLQ